MLVIYTVIERISTNKQEKDRYPYRKIEESPGHGVHKKGNQNASCCKRPLTTNEGYKNQNSKIPIRLTDSKKCENT